jgi:prepilin-type N-terminal cleavage/methylation domain-containing protein
MKNRAFFLRHRRQATRGLTLVEMLVGMVILGFMLTLVSQAVQQVSQLVRAAESTTRRITGGWAGAWALQPTLANLVWPIENLSDGFKGGADRIDGFTNAPISGAGEGVQAFTFELRRGAPAAGHTEVWATWELRETRETREAKRTGEPSSQLVGKLDGMVQFAYVDQAGTASPVWPLLGSKPAQGEEVALPSAVILQRLDDRRTLMWFGFEGEKLLPRPPSKPFWE